MAAEPRSRWVVALTVTIAMLGAKACVHAMKSERPAAHRSSHGR